MDTLASSGQFEEAKVEEMQKLNQTVEDNSIEGRASPVYLRSSDPMQIIAEPVEEPARAPSPKPIEPVQTYEPKTIVEQEPEKQAKIEVLDEEVAAE